MATTDFSSAAFAQNPARQRLETFFFPFMAVLILASVFLGFARTFFLAPIYHYHLPNVLVAIHGVVFASWIALFAIQTSLVAVGRTDLHRKLGVFGLFGTIAMIGPAIARWPFAIIASKPPLVGVVLQLFGIAVLVFDLLTTRRVYRATWIGVAMLFLVPAIAIPLSTTPFWLNFLASLKQFLAHF